MKKLCLILFTVLICSSFTFFRPVKAAAVEEGSLGAYPTNFDPGNPKTKSWFIYELKPGETKEDSITVVNNTDHVLNVKVYPVDATTTADGAFALLNEDQRQNDVGSWVTVSKSEITLEARGRLEVPFTISIPKYATIGDHAGGIIVQENKKQGASNSGMGLNIVSRVGTRIYETVPGTKVVKMSLSNLQYKIADDHLVFSFVMSNDGNIILTPTGTLEIKDSSGKVIETIQLGNLGSIFPGKPTTITAKATQSAPFFGQFSATVTVNYSPVKSVSESMQFTIYVKDWKAVLPVPGLILLVALYIAVKKIFRHKGKVNELKEKINAAKPVMHPLHTDTEPADTAAVKPSRLKTLKLKKQTVPAFTSAVTDDNLDRLFIAHHIKLIGVLILGTIVILSLLFAFILQSFVMPELRRNPVTEEKAAVQQQPADTRPAIVPTAVPTEIPVSKADMKVVVLNGTDRAGAAKQLGGQLTAAGFTVTGTDNAPENVTHTIILYPKGMNQGADLLNSELKSTFTNITREATDAAEFTVIIGE